MEYHQPFDQNNISLWVYVGRRENNLIRYLQKRNWELRVLTLNIFFGFFFSTYFKFQPKRFCLKMSSGADGRIFCKKFNRDFCFYFVNTVKPVYNDQPWDLNLWPLLTGGRCSVVALCYTNWKRDLKVVTSGRYSEVVVNSGLTVCLKNEPTIHIQIHSLEMSKICHKKSC